MKDAAEDEIHAAFKEAANDLGLAADKVAQCRLKAQNTC
jgi:hypothetical protein